MSKPYIGRHRGLERIGSPLPLSMAYFFERYVAPRRRKPTYKV